MKNNAKKILQILKELDYVLNSKQKKRAVLVFFVVIISSFFELIGVSAVLPFIQAVIAPEKIMSNLLIEKIMIVLGITSSQGVLLLMGIAMIIIYILKNIYMIFSYYVQYDYSTKIQKELSIKMLNSFMNRPYSYFLNTNSSEVLRGCSTDIVGVYNIISYLISILTECLSIAMIGGFILYTDPFIAIGVLGLMLIVLVGIVLVFKPTIKRAGKKNLELGTLRYKAISQATLGIKEIFVMQRKEEFTEKYVKTADDYRKIQRTYAVLNNSPERIVEGICISGIIGIVCFRLAIFDVDMLEFIPKLGAFAMAAFKVLPSIGKLANRITGIVYERPALENVYNNVRKSDEYDKEMQEYIKEKVEKEQSIEGLEFREQLVIHDINWKYNEQNGYVLNGLNLVLNKGNAIAFIGESGSGKTTLSDIILGLLHPKKGTIEMDGIDIFAIPKQWARIVGYVPQSVFLIDDTVRNNVAFGVRNIKDEDIWDALQRAQLDKFIKTLPNGLDTVVGERGIKFSGGQRQRLAIARALFNKPEILVLDEATAALDNETESAVMEAIESLKGTITMIIVAHRLSTIRNCDKIYEIKGGQAIEREKEEVLKGIV